MLSLSIYLIFQNFNAKNVSDYHALLGEIIYSITGGIVLIFLAWGFYEQRRFPRSPAVLINLIALGISFYMFNAKLLLMGTLVAVISLGTLIFALSIIPE